MYYGSLTEFSSRSILYGLLFYLVLKIKTGNECLDGGPEDGLKGPLKIFCLMMTVESFVIFYQFAGFSKPLNLTNKVALIGTLGNPNLAGCVLSLILPYCIYAYVKQKDKKYKLIYLAFPFIGLAGIILTMSRGAWTSLIIGGSVFVLSYILKTNNKRKYALITAVAVIIPSLLWGFIK